MIVPLRRLAHVGNNSLDATKTAEEVRLHHLPKCGERGFFDRPSAPNARVVDQDVDRAPFAGDLREAVAHRIVVVDIDGGKVNGELLIRGDLTDLRAAIDVTHRRHDRVSGARERDSRRKPDAAARTRHNR
jgi:hypothetical protein